MKKLVVILALVIGLPILLCGGCLGLSAILVPTDAELEQMAANAPPPTAEEQAKAEAEREQAEAAAAERERIDDIHVDEFRQWIVATEQNSYIKNAYINENGYLIVTVRDVWHVLPYQTRLQAAQRLVAEWRRIHSRELVKIEDGNENEVGGMGVLSGVWVQEDK